MRETDMSGLVISATWKTLFNRNPLILRRHAKFNLTSVADAIAVANDKLLPSLRTRRKVKYTGIAWSVGHVDYVVGATAIERQEYVGIDKILHCHDCRELVTRENVA